MSSPKADPRLQVHIPTAADDRPSWTKVGVITAIGFIVGIAWPRVMGVRLGPSVPSDVASVAAAASGAPSEASSGLATAPPSAPAVAAVPAAPTSAPPAVTVGHGVVFACKTSDGDSLKGSECGSLPGLDSLVMPRLRNLADCPEAASVTGKMHFVARIDFGHAAVAMELGRGQTVPSPDALLACAKTDITGLSLAGITHDNPRYSVAYTVTFDAGAAAAGSASAGAAGDADGSAQVVWEVAIVRDAPKTGKVVARLQRGATVHLGTAKDGWYPVKFGDGFGSDGWLYRGAVGR
jgi:hypothetical protein